MRNARFSSRNDRRTQYDERNHARISRSVQVFAFVSVKFTVFRQIVMDGIFVAVECCAEGVVSVFGCFKSASEAENFTRDCADTAPDEHWFVVTSILGPESVTECPHTHDAYL